MVNSIIYFEEHCIINFEKLEDDFFKEPKNFAEYVYGITDVFRKTPFLNKQTKERSYLPGHILGLEPNRRLTEDASGRMLEEADLKFWNDIYQYLERNYDLDQVKKIYLNAGWIKTGAKRLKGAVFVLDGFHLEKYLIRLVPHLKKKDRASVLEEFRKTIRDQTKRDFRELVDKQKKEMPKWRNRHGELGKYLESIGHSLSLQNKKKEYFQTQIVGL